MTRYKKFFDQEEMKKISETNLQNFLNTLWECTGGKEDKDNFIQKALKVFKVFKVKPLTTPRPDVQSKKTACNLFCKDIGKIKKELQGVPISKASVIISEEWEKVKANDKKMKSTETFTKKRNNNMNRPCRDIKKIIWMKWRLLTSTKGAIRQTQNQLQRQPQRLIGVGITFFCGSSLMK